MGNAVLAEVQTALLDAARVQVQEPAGRLLSAQPQSLSVQPQSLSVQPQALSTQPQALSIQPQALSPLLTNYLDTLLQSATEIPEASLEQFACLHFAVAESDFFVPLSRISRIDYAADFRRRFAFEIPDYGCAGRFMFQIQANQGWLFFDELMGLDNILSEDVIWRATADRAPWFVGTHKAFLRRIFDPEVLIERQQKTG